MTDNEILFYIDDIKQLPLPKRINELDKIRLLCDAANYNMVNEFLKDINRKLPTSIEEWISSEREDIIYYGMFLDNKLVATGCIEKYSGDKWETADIRTLRSERGKGYASQIVYYITKSILEQGITATIRTTEDNIAMMKVIKNLNFKL